jgi:hypothetical protein
LLPTFGFCRDASILLAAAVAASRLSPRRPVTTRKAILIYLKINEGPLGDPFTLIRLASGRWEVDMGAMLPDQNDADSECSAQITAAWERWVHCDLSYEQLEIALLRLKAEVSSRRTHSETVKLRPYRWRVRRDSFL